MNPPATKPVRTFGKDYWFDDRREYVGYDGLIRRLPLADRLAAWACPVGCRPLSGENQELALVINNWVTTYYGPNGCPGCGD